VTKAVPADPVPHFYLGSLQYERKQFTKAKSHLSEPETWHSTTPKQYLWSWKHIWRAGRVFSRSGDAADAAGRISKSELVFRCGTLFARYGFYPRAILAFERIKFTYADRYALLLNLGTAQLEARQYRPAVESLKWHPHCILPKPMCSPPGRSLRQGRQS